MGSMWTTGFKVMRPWRRAVSSPILSAAHAWAASWNDRLKSNTTNVVSPIAMRSGVSSPRRPPEEPGMVARTLWRADAPPRARRQGVRWSRGKATAVRTERSARWGRCRTRGAAILTQNPRHAARAETRRTHAAREKTAAGTPAANRNPA